MSVATIDPDCDTWDGLISVDWDGEVVFENVKGQYPYNTPLGPMFLGDAEKIARAVLRLRECWDVAWEARRARGFGRYGGSWPKVDPGTLAVTWPDEAR